MNDQIKKLWWLWLPILVFAVQIIMELFLPLKLMDPYYAENGILEQAQFLVIGSAFIFSLLILWALRHQNLPWVMAWTSIAALGSFYIAGEEVSWGQHILGWGTPEQWAQVNDQGETNLHNTTSWLDQKPRILLIVGIAVGGLVLPLLKKYKEDWLPKKFTLIYPPSCMAVIAALAIFPSLTVKIGELFDIVLFGRVSELQELYLYYFVLVYLMALKKRIEKA